MLLNTCHLGGCCDTVLPKVDDGGRAHSIDPEDGLGRKNLFGRADLATVYRRARSLIVKHGIFRMVQVEQDGDGTKRIIICNLWRIDCLLGGNIKTHEFSLADESWGEVSALDYWPDVPLFPIQQSQSLDWWRDVAKRAIWKVLIASGYSDLPRHLTESPRLDMSPSKMAYILIMKYVGKVTGQSRKGKITWREGFLKPKIMMAGARALRAAIFGHLLDAGVLSAMLAIEYRLVTLRGYLQFARHRDALLRVSTERRNLLPLLPEISRGYWGREDLFSHKLWVRGGRKRTLVDYPRFGSSRDTNRFSSFESRGAFRWLCKAQLTVVRSWVSAGRGRKHVTVLENLAKANINVRIPAIAWCHLVEFRYRVELLGVGEPVQRLYRAFASHCAVLWNERGFAAVKRWLLSVRLSDMADWMAAEGVAQGQPDKNATWTSLQRRSADWHERVALENIERSTETNQSWESLVMDLDVDGVTLAPLNSTKEIILEGHRLHHCVGGYDRECLSGLYRVYTMIEPDGTRSTIGLRLDQGKRWTIDQHRGKYNGGVSEVARNAGEHLLGLYQQAFVASTKNRCCHTG